MTSMSSFKIIWISLIRAPFQKQFQSWANLHWIQLLALMISTKKVVGKTWLDLQQQLERIFTGFIRIGPRSRFHNFLVKFLIHPGVLKLEPYRISIRKSELKWGYHVKLEFSGFSNVFRRHEKCSERNMVSRLAYEKRLGCSPMKMVVESTTISDAVRWQCTNIPYSF